MSVSGCAVAGLLLTPEETNTPPELVALEERMADGVTAVDGPIQTQKTKIPAPPMSAPTPAATFAPVTVTSVAAATALVTTKPGEAANDSISAPHDEDIVGILSVSNLPARVPLQMEAAAPQYLRPRDALTDCIGCSAPPGPEALKSAMRAPREGVTTSTHRVASNVTFGARNS